MDTTADTLTASLGRFTAVMLAYGAWVADPRDVRAARADVAAAARAVVADFDGDTVMAYAHHGDLLRHAARTAAITRRVIGSHMTGTAGTDADPHRNPRTMVSAVTAAALRARARAGLAA